MPKRAVYNLPVGTLPVAVLLALMWAMIPAVASAGQAVDYSLSASSSTDSDNDGMPDSYENDTPGLDPNDPDDARDDEDGDKLNNLAEYNDGSDPNQPDSDIDGIGDYYDLQPIVGSNQCSNDDAVLFSLDVSNGENLQCAAESSIDAQSGVTIADGGRLELISPNVTLEDGFSVPGGAELDVVTSTPTPPPCTPTASTDATCDGINDDCDGQVDEDYTPQSTSCGTGACAATGQTSCEGGRVVDSCEAGAPAANDATCNGVDDDCDGEVDEDYTPQATSCGTGACAATGMTSCQNGEVVDSCDAGSPAANDATCNGVDDDCDGEVDEDYTPQSTSCGTGACAATGMTSCQNGEITDSCQAGEPSAEVCNGADDDCDGEIDEDYTPQTTSCGTGACSSTGMTSCQNGEVVDSCEPGTPAANDDACNGVDDDCDGEVDEDYAPQATSCGTGACSATGMTSCQDGQVTDSCEPGTPTDEVCNGIDDDCDGSIDEGGACGS